MIHVYVLMADSWYEGGDPVAVSQDLDAMKRHAEKLEHGKRKNPRTYKWEAGEDWEEPGTIYLHSTRGHQSSLRIVPRVEFVP